MPWAEMLTVLRDEQQVQDPEELEVTGIVPEVEKQLSSIFVADMQYKVRLPRGSVAFFLSHLQLASPAAFSKPIPASA